MKGHCDQTCVLECALDCRCGLHVVHLFHLMRSSKIGQSKITSPQMRVASALPATEQNQKIQKEGGSAQPPPRGAPRKTFLRYCVFGKCIGLVARSCVGYMSVLLSFCVCLVFCGLVCSFKNGQVLGHNFWGIKLVLG